MNTIHAIAAMARNRIIGVENRLPWHLPEDLSRFKQLTLHHPIIMGRKTFNSLGRALPHRINIVLTHQDLGNTQDILAAHTWEEAKEVAFRHGDLAFVIGGGEIFRMSLPEIQRLYLTIIDQEVAGSVSFPSFEKEFKIVQEEVRSTPFAFRFTQWERTA